MTKHFQNQISLLPRSWCCRCPPLSQWALQCQTVQIVRFPSLAQQRKLLHQKISSLGYAQAVTLFQAPGCFWSSWVSKLQCQSSNPMPIGTWFIFHKKTHQPNQSLDQPINWSTHPWFNGQWINHSTNQPYKWSMRDFTMAQVTGSWWHTLWLDELMKRMEAISLTWVACKQRETKFHANPCHVYFEVIRYGLENTLFRHRIDSLTKTRLQTGDITELMLARKCCDIAKPVHGGQSTKKVVG